MCPHTPPPQFPATQAASDRVLKQNRGSTGSGIWVVQPHRWARRPGLALTPGHLLRVTQMLDNRRQVMSLADFLRLCEQYITGASSTCPLIMFSYTGLIQSRAENDDANGPNLAALP